MPPGRRLVVDASVAVKWHLLDEENLAQANELLVQAGDGEIVLLAPDLIWAEVGSAITNASRGRSPRLDAVSGEVEIAAFLSLSLEVYSSRELLLSAYRLVHEHGCALYDAAYLALALRLGVPFITADRRLFQRVGHLPNVVWLGDYSFDR